MSAETTMTYTYITASYWAINQCSAGGVIVIIIIIVVVDITVVSLVLCSRFLSSFSSRVSIFLSVFSSSLIHCNYRPNFLTGHVLLLQCTTTTTTTNRFIEREFTRIGALQHVASWHVTFVIFLLSHLHPNSYRPHWATVVLTAFTQTFDRVWDGCGGGGATARLTSHSNVTSTFNRGW